MKAWRVDDFEDEFSTIVYAGTRNKARVLGSAIFDEPYIGVKVKRVSWADDLAQKGGEIDWNDKEVAKTLRDMGWWFCNPACCEVCGLYEWDVLKNSYLVDGVCGDCRKKEKQDED